MSFDIITATKNISSKYTRYLKTIFDIDDPVYKELFDKEMEQAQTFSKGPFLDVVDSFQSGHSVEELIQEGVLDPDFRFIKDIREKTLYKHQEKSIRKLSSGKNIVVSTGTGSGKTESFLIPILDSLMREKREKGKLTPGVRALLIYPMNALANDQISRLRRALENYPDITYGAYTGQTEEGYDKALRKYKELNHNQVPKKNELIAREQMKDAPPHILITNYSMLEYLMLRPRDNTFFQGKYAGNWRFVVLDEAHTYSGSTGIEVSMLLRRLRAYLPNKDLRYVLTSATLGDEKSNREAALFAQNLCSAPFYEEDIIRAERIHLHQEDRSLNLSGEDYLELNDILESGNTESIICRALDHFFSKGTGYMDSGEYLYDALQKDSTFWTIKDFMSQPRSIVEIRGLMKWTDPEVSAFVNVASKAVHNRKKLFDARYHMFLRASDGVFITLGNHKELSLTRKTKTFAEGQEYRFFEISTCSQCHAIYLIGNEEGDYLVQKANAGGTDVRDAFLLGDAGVDEDEDTSTESEELRIEQYELCPHCGFIRRKATVNKRSCGHDRNEFVTLTRVKLSSKTGRVTKCIKCQGVNNMGILRPFFSGQEASTSVIGTALFEELPEKETVITEHSFDDGFDDGFDVGFDIPSSASHTTRAKQFIAFSDNRQAAAYFATYFAETYQGLLYSRIIYKNLQEMDGSSMPLSSFVNRMSADFRERRIADMFDDHPDYTKEAWKAILKELVDCRARNSLMGLGMMGLDLDDDIKIAPNGKYGCSEEDVRNICLVWLQSMLEENSIAHGQRFTEADLDFYSHGGSSAVYVFSNPADKYTKSFAPKTDITSNKRMDYLERVLERKEKSFSREEMIKFMGAVWKFFFEQPGLLVEAKDYKGKQIDARKLKVVRQSKWYKCSRCQRLTPYNVAGVCPAYKCDGELQEVDIEAYQAQNHYYRLFKNLALKPLRVVEHTAQLSREEAYELQEKFKNQEIDVLSCSTTFEMGVDIGDLETVFMRNMPPLPANYVQRAGRAGRSIKSAALALTFCNKSNHDFSFFQDPVSMINGEIKPPLFKVENEKIGIRHLYSAALSFFWRSDDRFFGKVKDMFGDETEGEGYDCFKRYLESHPSDLRMYLERALPGHLVEQFGVHEYSWVGWLFDDPDPTYPNLQTVFRNYREEVDSLYQEKRRLEADNRSNYSVLNRIKNYTEESLISFLSRANILPKYGFPVDTVELQVSTGTKNDPLRVSLNRDLSMAISEYAPGCEVVAAGHLIRSRYIKKMVNRDWRLYDYVRCEQCNTLNIKLHLDSDEEQLIRCERCGAEFSRKHSTFLVPEFGFVSDGSQDRPTLIKPDRSYRTEASMVSYGKTINENDLFIGSMHVQTTAMEDGEIAILNSDDFYVCTTCGFALGRHDIIAHTNTIQQAHKNASGYTCGNKKLHKYSLGYRFKTDAIAIKTDGIYTWDEAYSILQAIILSACNHLNIDNGEIAGCLQYSVDVYGPSYDFVLYDRTPGGAGHVRRINDPVLLEQTLKGAYLKAKNCDCGGDEADTSCYKCLRTYQNQHYHDKLKRRYVIDGLRRLFD